MAMAIEIRCGCGKRYKVDDAMAGKRVRCKACGKVMRVEEVVELSADMLEEEQFVDLDAAVVPAPPPLPRARAAASQHPSSSASPASPPFVAIGAPEVPGPQMGSWSTMASNPALLRLRPLVYLKNHPGPLIVLGGWLLISTPYFFMKHSWIGWVIAILGIAWFWFQLYRMQRKLAYGCVNPAMVVGTNRVAIFTDLTTGGPTRPAIKVISAPLDRVKNQSVEVGTPMAVVALYAPGGDPDAWNDIDETLIQLATNRPEQIARIMASIPPDEWDAMARFLPYSDPARTGIYKCWKAGADQFTPQNPMTVWIVFAIFCITVMGFGIYKLL
jgi:hypothetical protein